MRSESLLLEGGPAFGSPSEGRGLRGPLGTCSGKEAEADAEPSVRIRWDGGPFEGLGLLLPEPSLRGLLMPAATLPKGEGRPVEV